jgi:hypothetical protein
MKPRFPWIHLSFVFLVTQCGVPEPKLEEQSSNVPPVSFPEVEPVLGLLGETRQEYEGSLIFWDAKASPKEVAKMVKLSEESRDHAAKYYPMFRKEQVIETNLKGDKDRLTLLNEDSQRQESIFNESQRFVILQQTKAWLIKHLDAAQMDAYHRYCDFSLLKFALSDMGALSYRERPTSVSVCEHSYVERGFFASDECKAGQEKYASCLWNDGLLHARSFLQWQHSSKKPLSPTELEEFKKNLVTTLAEVNRTLLMKLNKFGSKYRVVLQGTTLPFAKIITDLPTVFVPQEERRQSFSQLSMEKSDGTSVFTISDAQFNFPLLSDTKQMPKKTDDVQAVLSTLLAQDADLVASSNAFEDPNLVERATVATKVKEQEKALADSRTVSFPYLDAYKSRKTEAASYIRDQGLAHALWPDLWMEYEKKGHNLVVKMRLKAFAPIWVACFNLEDRISFECARPGQINFPSVLFDEKLGKLTLQMTAIDSARLGFFVE